MATILDLINMNDIFGKTSTKNKIVLIISKRPGLTGKEISVAIKRNSRKRLTAQAVYKTLQELANVRVLLKKNKKYSINKDWVKKIKKQ
ncbi:MAG: hypothetical protein Q7K34_03475, partial [archaeon]|nr:hypothetical protein [archaeon]